MGVDAGLRDVVAHALERRDEPALVLGESGGCGRGQLIPHGGDHGRGLERMRRGTDHHNRAGSQWFTRDRRPDDRRTLAGAEAREGILTNAVHPGFTLTERALNHPNLGRQAVVSESRKTPTGRICTPNMSHPPSSTPDHEPTVTSTAKFSPLPVAANSGGSDAADRCRHAVP